MPRSDKTERRLKRLRSIEASYRRDMKRAEKAFQEGRITRERLEKISTRLNKKIGRMHARIRELAHKGD